MDEATAAALRQINRRFYRRYAAHFSATRGGHWQGWERLAAGKRPRRVLDLGCGNGRFFSFLSRYWPSDEPLFYVGVDESLALLVAARRAGPGCDAHFVRADFIATPPSSLFEAGRFDLIVAFGVLHHVPGSEQRVALLRCMLHLLAPGGEAVCTFWQFEDDPRFASRKVDWARAPVALATERLEPGDHLLRWGDSREEDALRYCHSTPASEVEELARQAGADVARSAFADGKSGRLNYYAWLRPAGSDSPR